MVDHHAARLHESVTDDRADKVEALVNESGGHDPRGLVFAGDVCGGSPPIEPRPFIHE